MNLDGTQLVLGLGKQHSTVFFLKSSIIWCNAALHGVFWLENGSHVSAFHNLLFLEVRADQIKTQLGQSSY